MKAKLLSTVAVASLGVFLMMDSGAAFAKETCSIGNRDSMFGGGCRVEQGYRNGRDGMYRYRPRNGTDDEVEEAEVEDDDGDRKWGKHKRGKRHGKRGWGKHGGKHHGKHHGKKHHRGKHHGKKHHGGKHGGYGKHHGKHGGWGRHHGKHGGWDNDGERRGKHGYGKHRGKHGRHEHKVDGGVSQGSRQRQQQPQFVCADRPRHPAARQKALQTAPGHRHHEHEQRQEQQGATLCQHLQIIVVR